jgi:endonuclease YncB( thermonuclease family)
VILQDGHSLNKELIAAGMCWHYRKYDKDPELQRLEDSARARRIGLWAEPNPTPPWEWRHNKKKHTEELLPLDLTTDTPASFQ